MTVLREWLRTLTDVRPDEYLPTGLMFTYGFFALSSYYVLKPARNSVFVDRVGADYLPHVYVVAALVVIVLMLAYSRWVDRVDERRLLLSTLAFLALVLVGFWWLLGRGAGPVVAGSFYVWCKLYSLVLVSQFWLLGNRIFTTRQARRLFGPIGAGLVTGGIAGSLLASEAGVWVGTEDLLLVAVGLLGVCALLVQRLQPFVGAGEYASGRVVEEIQEGALRLLRDSSHLRTIALILGLTTLAGTLVDWQFNKAVDLFIPGEDAKTAYFGQFFVWLNVGSVVVQLLFTSFVLKRLGVGVAMLALPVTLTAATVGVAAAPVLLTAALAKGSEGALRYSLDQSTRELLYLPVPTEVKVKVKPLVDLAVVRGGSGVAGLILLGATAGLGFSIRQVALLTLIVLAAWIWAAFRMRSEYRASIRRLIGVRDVKLEELIVGRLDSATLDELRTTLREAGEQEVLYALSLLEDRAAEDFTEELKRLLRHESSEVRGRALSLLQQAGTPDAVDEARRLLDDPSISVRADAIHYVCAFGPLESAEQMDAFLRDRDPAVRGAAVSCLLQHGNEDEVELALATADGLARDDDPEVRREAARALTEVRGRTADVARLLTTLLRDPSPAVRCEAASSVGEAEIQELVPTLLELLEAPATRGAARAALARYGAEAHTELLAALRADETPRPVRRILPGLLVDRATQATVDGLLASLPDARAAAVRYETLKALNKLRRDRLDLSFADADGAALAHREVREAYAWSARRVDAAGLEKVEGGTAGTEGSSLLVRTLDQRRMEAVERAFRALALDHGPGDLYTAFRALESPERTARERGFELLDTALPPGPRFWFDPLVDPEATPEDRARAAAFRYGVERRGPRETVERLARSDDFWVALLARRARGHPLLPDDETRKIFHERLRAEALAGSGRLPSGEELDPMHIMERAEALRRAEIFARLRTEDLAALAALTEERALEAGEVAFHRGTTGCSLYVVVEGELDAVRDDRTLFRAGVGRTVGELSVLDGQPTHYRAEARQPTRVLVIGREALFNLMEERFRVSTEVMAYLAGMVREEETVGAAG